MTAADARFSGNLLLRALRDEDRALIAPHLEPVAYAAGTRLFAAGAEVSHITFPCDHAVVSLVVSTRDGRSAATATIGHEGAVGGVAGHGLLPASTHAVVQFDGPMLRLEADRLREAGRRSAHVRDLFARAADCLLAQALQAAACAALHPIEQRTLRALLTLHDRIGGQILPITHESMAAMLGVQRTYLTRILRTLQEQGLIRVGRGRITVLDRRGMEAAACECHARVRAYYEMVLGAIEAVDGYARIDPRDAVMASAHPAATESY